MARAATDDIGDARRLQDAAEGTAGAGYQDDQGGIQDRLAEPAALREHRAIEGLR